MWYNKRLYKAAATILFVSIFAFGCSDDSTGPEVNEGPPPPSFSIATITVTVDGVPFIGFSVRPSEDILLGRVEISPPIGNTQTYSGGNGLFLGGQNFNMDTYVKVSGTWNFRFVGQHSPGGEPFDVRQSLGVSAKSLAGK